MERLTLEKLVQAGKAIALAILCVLLNPLRVQGDLVEPTDLSDWHLTSPWLVSGLVATAVAVPVAVGDDRAPANGPFDDPAADPPDETTENGHTRYVFGQMYPDVTANGLQLSAQTTTGRVSMTTQATLCYVREDGTDVEPLLRTTYILVGTEPILVPYIWSSTDHLFVMVDLRRWVQNPVQYEVGDRISITLGTSPRLPGFLVATEPIEFHRTHGWTTTAPYTGDVAVGGFYGVQLVPEPATLWLLGMGLMGTAAWRRRRTRPS